MTPGWTVAFAAAAVDDLGLLETHLTRAYRDFGESPADATRHAEVRTEAIIAPAERLATAPFRGTAHDGLLPRLWHLVLDSSIYWFVSDADRRQVRVLAMVFGGQGHQRHILVRLLGRGRR